MRLLVTLGATKPKPKHIYYINGKKFENKRFSFEALKDYYNIEDKDVIIFGTDKTKEILEEEGLLNYSFKEVESGNLEGVIESFVNEIQKDDILDLTQSFRSISFGALISYSFSKNLGKNVKNIYYAQVRDGKNPARESTENDFISLKKYEDIVDLFREINLFLDSWYVVPDEKDETKIIHNNLKVISERLLVNNLEIDNEIKNILNEIERLNKKYPFLKVHLSKLQEELKKLESILSFKESLRLFKMSNKYFEKNLLLQSLTMLFEASLAYLDEKTENNFVCRKGNQEYTKCSDKYKFRNCLKSNLSSVRRNKPIKSFLKKFIAIKNLEEFARHLMKIDELRNDSAHAFINTKKLQDFKQDIKGELEFFRNIIK